VIDSGGDRGLKHAYRRCPVRWRPEGVRAGELHRAVSRRASAAVLERIQRDVDSGLASGQVLGTPTLFIDGVVHRGGYDPRTLPAALTP
jgi:hypothetical protein